MLVRLWNLLCSLKLAIWLASIATGLTMAGSIVMIKFPKTFGSIDQMTLADWFRHFGQAKPALSWWLYLTAVAVVLLGINTLCCFCDWLLRFRARWRKSGEYLIHLGFVFCLAGLIWGSIAGSRSEGNAIRVGETLPLGPIAPGYALRLDAFEPVFVGGQFSDMRSTLTLLRNGVEERRATIRLNHPLIEGDLIVLPATFGQEAEGFRCDTPQGSVELRPGSILRTTDGGALRVLRFYPDVRRGADSRPYPVGEELNNPAFELELLHPRREPWRGWYVLREGLPTPLAAGGVLLVPREPLMRTVSVLTINRDPGADLAKTGGMLIGFGVCLALVSFYAKRSRGDRPEIA
jgi:cytochrome c biogenesis protein